jgi:hypothetical protein
MAYPPKIEQALKVLEDAGVPKRRAAPWTHRLLWRLGIPVRPPQFYGPFTVFVNCAFFYGSGQVLAHWAIVGRKTFDQSFLVQCAVSTLIFSVIMLAFRTVRVAKYNLPPWSEIDDIASRFE